MKKIVGKVTEDEKNQIMAIYERKNGLNELAKVLDSSDSELYEHLIKDMGKTNLDFQQWWDDMYSKYKWESKDNCSWEINFVTNDIYLITL